MAALIDTTNALEIIKQCKADGDLTQERLQWEYIQEFLRKNHFLYLDTRGRKIVRLTDGVKIPWSNLQVSGSVNQPIDPHIVTIANGLEAKALSNWPFLMPFVRPATADDDDQDAAKACTLLLNYYREALNDEETYRKIVGYMKPCGNAFVKTYWDKNVGDYGAMNEQGEPMRLGDLACKAIMPSRMLVPKAIGGDDDLPWIGEQYALPVEEIADTFGVIVQEEGNLEELQFLQSVESSGATKTDRLKGHARVYEIYMRPTKSRPLGRLVICCAEKILYDGPWDAMVTKAFPDTWHPYDHVEWIRIEGDYWAKSPLFYVVEHQIQLNKLYKKYIESTRYSKGWWTSQEGAVDRKKINWDSETGTPWIEYLRGSGQPPTYVPPPLAKMEYLEGMNQIRNWMNDITAMYEVTRGNTDPNITSGRQVANLQIANSSQHSPLLFGLARATINVWKKRLRLCAVHFEDVGRTIRAIGENNDIVATRFTPDQITSDDIILATGQSFFLPPELRMQELDKAFTSGLMGDPNKDSVKKRYMELRGLGGGTEELYADYTADVTLARYENDLFEQGQFYEADQIMIKQDPLMQEYEGAIQSWQKQKQLVEEAAMKVQSGQLPMPPQMPQDPGPPPQPPKVYRMARDYDDDETHIEILNRFRKSHKFEQLCLQNPELRLATDAHYKSHTANLSKKMQNSPAAMEAQAEQGKQIVELAKSLIMAFGRSNGVNFPMDMNGLSQVENTLFNAIQTAQGGKPIPPPAPIPQQSALPPPPAPVPQPPPKG